MKKILAAFAAAVVATSAFVVTPAHALEGEDLAKACPPGGPICSVGFTAGTSVLRPGEMTRVDVGLPKDEEASFAFYQVTRAQPSFDKEHNGQPNPFTVFKQVGTPFKLGSGIHEVKVPADLEIGSGITVLQAGLTQKQVEDGEFFSRLGKKGIFNTVELQTAKAHHYGSAARIGFASYEVTIDKTKPGISAFPTQYIVGANPELSDYRVDLKIGDQWVEVTKEGATQSPVAWEVPDSLQSGTYQLRLRNAKPGYEWVSPQMVTLTYIAGIPQVTNPGKPDDKPTKPGKPAPTKPGKPSLPSTGV